ncbi:hypothetical protein LZ906_004760 [Paraclostridium ghonii]|uniref:hypothetical protein n=1 Tax=Paraclostridium ghonii TaxID=29358 RepID=UPI00202CA7C3|nr:hypothetical protein [Paeniclostridium ghonii]MCM0164952.1 hypothetical protein [Paeniclostridium ghonii]
MLKKLLNFIKVNKEEKISTEEIRNVDIQEELNGNLNIEESKNIVKEEQYENQLSDEVIEITKEIDGGDKKYINEEVLNTYEMTDEDKKYIKSVKIQREKRIKAIDVYTNDEVVFENHKDCGKTLCIPIQYIKENLEYGYTDYFGESINFLSKKLKIDISHKAMGDRNVVEVFNFLHNELWNVDIKSEKREEILCSDKIEPIHMHYKFEMMDDEYDDYYKKYGKIIRRGGKKKIELIDKKNEIIDVFKSLDDCASFFNKSKSEITERLKCGECKIGRYEIRYSLRR